MSGLLEAALRRFAARRHGRDAASETRRVRIEERLRALERDLSDVKARVNGLLFTDLGALAAEVVTRWVR